MPLVSMRQLLDHAAEHTYGIPTRKVVDTAHATGVTVEGGDRTWQRAHGGRQFIGAAGSGRDAEVFDGLAGRWRRGRRGAASRCGAENKPIFVR